MSSESVASVRHAIEWKHKTLHQAAIAWAVSVSLLQGILTGQKEPTKHVLKCVRRDLARGGR